MGVVRRAGGLRVGVGAPPHCSCTYASLTAGAWCALAPGRRGRRSRLCRAAYRSATAVCAPVSRWRLAPGACELHEFESHPYSGGCRVANVELKDLHPMRGHGLRDRDCGRGRTWASLTRSPLERRRRFESDVCIVGAGAAGLTLAEALPDPSRALCVLEAGGRSPEAATQALYEVAADLCRATSVLARLDFAGRDCDYAAGKAGNRIGRHAGIGGMPRCAPWPWKHAVTCPRAERAW